MKVVMYTSVFAKRAYLFHSSPRGTIPNLEMWNMRTRTTGCPSLCGCHWAVPRDRYEYIQ